MVIFVSKKKTKKCIKCQTEYNKKLLYCPKCGQIDERRALQLKALEIKEKNKTKLINCKTCNNQISEQAEFCPHCGQPTGIHMCPKCKSVNTETISGASKVASIAAWGVFATNKVKSTYRCKNCGFKF